MNKYTTYDMNILCQSIRKTPSDEKHSKTYEQKNRTPRLVRGSVFSQKKLKKCSVSPIKQGKCLTH